jgi:hypothetical protein
MRNVALAPVTEEISEMELVYGKFDLQLDGRPTVQWEGRNLKLCRFDEPLRHAFFPEVFVYKVLVNRRMLAPLGVVLREINLRWNRKERDAHGLNQFVKCYCFGDGDRPSLHWLGAAWELSPQVGGEVLTEVVKLFTRRGFTHGGAGNKPRIRTFEYW